MLISIHLSSSSYKNSPPWGRACYSTRSRPVLDLSIFESVRRSSMPRFLAYTPDVPNVLDKRMAVRPKHMERAKPDLEGGINGQSKLCPI